MTEAPFLAATRTAYDTIAADYAERFRAELSDLPLERALLAAYAELVPTAGPVADVGCGPGHVTARLSSLGLDAFGIDLSPAMVALARRSYPDLRFEVGSMTALDLPDGALGGIVAWYSTIHVPTGLLPGVFAEFRRVLAPRGWVSVGFLVGDERRRRTEAFGHEIELDYHLRAPEAVADLLDRAGFAVRARLLREPDEPGENLPRAYLLARCAPKHGDGDQGA
jgi:SAM-dependent methyltransferase